MNPNASYPVGAHATDAAERLKDVLGDELTTNVVSFWPGRPGRKRHGEKHSQHRHQRLTPQCSLFTGQRRHLVVEREIDLAWEVAGIADAHLAAAQRNHVYVALASSEAFAAIDLSIRAVIGN